MAKVDLVHAMERKIRVPDVGDPYWQTRCGIRLAYKTEQVATSDNMRSVTCAKCKATK